MKRRMVLDRPRGRFVVIRRTIALSDCKHCANTAEWMIFHNGESMTLCDDCLNLDQLGKW